MKIVNGDIFNSGAYAILHQVNCQGVMGSGVAKQVRDKFPQVYECYKSMCSEYPEKNERKALLGEIQVIPVLNGKQFIINLFAQEKFGYGGKCYTDYEALRRCLQKVKEKFCGHTIAIPYLMGCHRGGGDWEVVLKMIGEELSECDVTLYKYVSE